MNKAILRHSPRGLPLVFVGEVGDRPVLTVENYCKWYELFVVFPDGTIAAVSFPDDGQDTPYVDHVPNPKVVERFADKNDYHLDPQAFEMIVGRWYLEVKTWQ